MIADAASNIGTARIVLGATPDFDLGSVHVRPTHRDIVLPNGEVRELEPRVMQVLVALALPRPDVVTRDRLIELCWEGRIVSEDAINRCILALRRLARSIDPPPFTIETVARVGYSLVEGPIAKGKAGDPPTPARTSARRRRLVRQPWLALLAGLIVLAVAAGIILRPWGSPAEAAPASIAVLPFRNLSPGDDYFAEGVAEEILAQLARQPGLRVAGRTSSWQFKDRTAGVEEIGRKLGVSYVLEGSVRSAGERVRVNVLLANASDGLQLWSETFDGRLDDLFEIQNRIGASVANALGRKLAQARPAAGALATSGAVYSLYLSARGLIRERNPVAFAAAKEKLLRAVELDPNFAPAWAALAQTSAFLANAPGPEAARKREEAILQARKALALAPDLAEAHGVLGMILGFDDPVGQHHVKRAAALDPGNAQFQFWLGHVRANELDFPRMMTAYGNAFEIDPLWHYAQFQAVDTAWRMGRPQEAIGYLRRVERDGSQHQVHLLRSTLAQVRGDFSAAAGELAAAAAATDDGGKKAVAAYQRAFIFSSLGLHDRVRKEWSIAWSNAGKALALPAGRSSPEDRYFAMHGGKLPSMAELRSYSESHFDKDWPYAVIGAKMLINAGRARDVVSLYDSREGFLGLSRDRSLEGVRQQTLPAVPVVAAALLAVGRTGEADRIIAAADRLIEAGLARSRGEATYNFLAEAAQVWALRGKHAMALAALERARARGWSYVAMDEGDVSLSDMADEPAFRSLRGNPRFERLRAEINAHLARERRETAQLSI